MVINDADYESASQAAPHVPSRRAVSRSKRRIGHWTTKACQSGPLDESHHKIWKRKDQEGKSRGPHLREKVAYGSSRENFR